PSPPDVDALGFVGFGFAVTVTEQLAEIPLPSCAVHVIFALPALTAFTTPLLTVATLVLDDDHLTDLFAASVGRILALIVELFPSWSDREVGFNVICATGLLVVFGSFSISD